MNELTNTKKSFYFSKKVSIIDRYNFYEYVSVMLDSGVVLSDALESVKSKTKNPFFIEKIGEIITYINSGDSFSKAMKKIPSIFDAGEVSMIESGETIGALSGSLMKLSDALKKKYDLQLKIKNALTYPIIIFIFLIVAVIIVLTYVIPAIVPLFETTNVELPTATKALVATSDFIRTQFVLIVFLVLTFLVLLSAYKTTQKGREHIDSIKLGFPLIGSVYKNYILSQVASNMGSLLGAGVNVVKTLTLVGRSANNLVYQKIFEIVTAQVAKGDKIVDSIQEVDLQSNYFPADFTQMLSVGEKTANIDEISKKINIQYTKEVEYSLANLTKWIEPLSILIAGIFVLWFAFAIFGAILKVTQTVG